MPPRKKQASAPSPKKGGGADPVGATKEAAAAEAEAVPSPSPAQPAAAAPSKASPRKQAPSAASSDATLGARCGDELAQITRVLFQDPATAFDGKSRLKELDRTDFLETTLWPGYSAGAGFEETMLAILLINEKVAAQVAVFDAQSPLLHGPDNERTFAAFFDGVVQIADKLTGASTSGGAGGAGGGEQEVTSLWYLESYLVFLVHTYRAVENPTVRRCALRYVSLPLWTSLSAARLSDEMARHPQLHRHWQLLQSQGHGKPPGDDTSGAAAGKKRKATATSDTAPAAPAAEGAWVPSLVQRFLRLLDEVAAEPSLLQGAAPSPAARQAVRCLERSAELLVDLLSQLATRRFLNALLDDMHVAVRCRRALTAAAAAAATVSAPGAGEPPLRLLGQLLSLLVALMRFDVDDQTGAPLTAQDVEERLHARVHKLQTIAFTRLQVCPSRLPRAPASSSFILPPPIPPTASAGRHRRGRRPRRGPRRRPAAAERPRLLLRRRADARGDVAAAPAAHGHGGPRLARARHGPRHGRRRRRARRRPRAFLVLLLVLVRGQGAGEPGAVPGRDRPGAAAAHVPGGRAGGRAVRAAPRGGPRRRQHHDRRVPRRGAEPPVAVPV